MRIEWLDDDFNECRVNCRGKYAHLRRVFDHYDHEYRWRFVSTGRRAGFWLSWRLNRARRKERNKRFIAAEWQPLTNLPGAKVVTSSGAGRQR